MVGRAPKASAKRGRPRALTLNPIAVEDLLAERCCSKGELAESGGITTGHLADALYRAKGVSEKSVRGMAGRLRCQPGTLAPELSKRFTGVRDGDAAQAS